MKQSGNPSRRRGPMTSAIMNAALLVLLAGVFLWSVVGNAAEGIRSTIESRF